MGLLDPGLPSLLQSSSALGLCGGIEKWACVFLLSQEPGSSARAEDFRRRATCLPPRCSWTVSGRNLYGSGRATIREALEQQEWVQGPEGLYEAAETCSACKGAGPGGVTGER